MTYYDLYSKFCDPKFSVLKITSYHYKLSSFHAGHHNYYFFYFHFFRQMLNVCVTACWLDGHCGWNVKFAISLLFLENMILNLCALIERA